MISSSQPAQKEFFLHVMSLAEEAAGVERPTVVDLSTETTAVAWIADQQIVAFNKTEAPVSSVAWTMPTPLDRAVVVGVEPNARYSARAESVGDQSGGYRAIVERDPAGPFVSSEHGIVDTSIEASPSGAAGDEDSGCGCVTAGARTAQGFAAALCLLPLLLGRRRRSKRNAAGSWR